MSEWSPVPTSEVARHLAPLTARGDGRVRARSVNTVEVTVLGDGPRRDVVVEVSDAGLGRYQVHLRGCTPRDGWAHVDQLLERGTWEVHDAAGNHYGTDRPARGGSVGQTSVHLARESLGGYAATSLTCDALEVQTTQAAGPEGSCLVCGSSTFTLQAHASVPVQVSGTDLSVTGPLTLRDVFVRLRCDGCGTLHPATTSDRLRGLTLEGEALPARLLRDREVETSGE